MKDLCILIPAFNEAKSLPELIARIKDVLLLMSLTSSEIIVVNDGSIDGTSAVISRLSKSIPIRELRFRRNMGKAMALMVGFNKSDSRYLISIDADLQDYPEDIPKIYDKLKSGYDLVCGERVTRNHSKIRGFGSYFYNFFMRKITGISIRDSNGGLKGYSNKLYKNISIHGQLHRFITLIASLGGFKIGSIPVKNAPRKHGISKYPAVRYESAFDLISIYFIYKAGHVPLHFYAKVSMIIFIPALIGALYFFFSQSLYWMGFGAEHKVFMRPLLLLIPIGLISGIQIFLTGMLFEFILNRANLSTEKYIQMNLEI